MSCDACQASSNGASGWLSRRKDAAEADTIDDLRALLPARAGDEFQTSEPSEEVPSPIDEHPEEEQ